MELDKRILEGKKPLDCFDVGMAEQFIGKKGYVTDFLKEFCDLNKVRVSELKTVLHTELFCYLCGSTGKKYFLPVEWVKEPEKKYRPLTLPEFTDLIGKPLYVRAIKPRIQRVPVHIHSNPWLAVITQVWQDIEDGEVYVQLGNTKYTNKVLWNAFEYTVLGDGKCEYFDGKEWKPFGVEE